MTLGPLPAVPGTRLVPGPAGPVETLLSGHGGPVTVFVHGLGGSIADTRPFGSGVAGTRVFLHLRGHGATPLPPGPGADPDPGDIDDLAAEVEAVLEATGATRALGVSLGALAVLRLLVRRPDALQRAVLVLPPAEVPEPAVPVRLARMAAAVESGDVGEVARLLREHQPPAVRALPAVGIWARRRAAELVGMPVATMVRRFAGGGPYPEAGVLAGVTATVLIIAQADDPVHPAAAAARLAGLLPAARLEVLPPGGVPWRSRALLRSLLVGFLDGVDGLPAPGRSEIA